MRWSLTVCLLLLGCPERAKPERGVQLVFAKPDTQTLRPVVERRLAQLKLKAHLSEDDKTLAVRVRDGEGADLAVLKRALTFPAKLEFCPEEVPVATTWCTRELPPGVTTEDASGGCALVSSRQADVEALFTGDAGVPDVAFEHAANRHVVYAIAQRDCFTPHVIAAEPSAGEQPNLLLDFDKPGTRAFAELTTKGVKHRLIIRLDDQVRSAPVVLEPLTTGRAGLLLERDDDPALLGAALLGGALPQLKLKSEDRYGPPSLK